jgi:hypothetical protein
MAGIQAGVDERGSGNSARLLPDAKPLANGDEGCLSVDNSLKKCYLMLIYLVGFTILRTRLVLTKQSMQPACGRQGSN